MGKIIAAITMSVDGYTTGPGTSRRVRSQRQMEAILAESQSLIGAA